MLRVVTWLPSYSRKDLVGDVSGGLTVSVLLVPQAIAYSLLVEVPPCMGLYASCVPLVIFALFTSSRHLCVGPFALVSLVVASVSSRLVPEDHTDVEYVQAVLALCLVTGCLQCAMGLGRLGLISSFLADPSIEGFTTAVALIIMASQLKYVLGVSIPRGTMPATVVRAVGAVAEGEISWWAVGTTVAAYTLMAAVKELGARCCRPGTPVFEQLVAVVLFTALQYALVLPLEVIGDIPRGLPLPAVPALPSDFDAWVDHAQGGLVVAFTSFLVSMSIARAFAGRFGYSASANQELLGLGLANVGAAFFGGFPISGSFSRTAVGASVGIRTPLHGLVQATVVALVLVWITPLFRTLPFAVLAAIILSALRSLVSFSGAVRLWASSRADCALWAIAFVVTASLDVEAGLIASFASSLGMLVLQTSRPRWALLGRLPGTRLYRDLRRYPSAEAAPGTLIFRWDAPLHFANAAHFGKVLRRRLRAARATGNPPVAIVLDCSSMHSIDASAHAVLLQLVTDLRAEGVGLLLAGSKSGFRNALKRFGTLGRVLGERQVFTSVADAVDHGIAAPPPASSADGQRPARLQHTSLGDLGISDSEESGVGDWEEGLADEATLDSGDAFFDAPSDGTGRVSGPVAGSSESRALS